MRWTLSEWRIADQKRDRDSSPERAREREGERERERLREQSHPKGTVWERRNRTGRERSQDSFGGEVINIKAGQRRKRLIRRGNEPDRRVGLSPLSPCDESNPPRTHEAIHRPPVCIGFQKRYHQSSEWLTVLMTYLKTGKKLFDHISPVKFCSIYLKEYSNSNTKT